MRRFLLPAFVLPLSLSLSSPAATPVNPRLDPAAREVLDYLASVYGRKQLSGYNVYVHTPDDYEQTGKQAAVWGRDIRWLGDCEEAIDHAKRHRYILTLHWHWFFAGDSAWTQKRKTPVDVGKLVTPGTNEHWLLLKELDATADTLQKFEDAGIPILWRPLHEIDGGWFWWTDKENPQNTAKLWQIMFDHFTNKRKLHNLIWVYSAGVGRKTVAQREGYYPGAEFVDISGIDIYGVDFQTADPKYHQYWNVMTEVSPGKMLACGEGDAMPDPDRTEAGTLPNWLWVLPWWGAPSGRRPASWATRAMRHDHIITLDELPAFGKGNIAPHVGILKPLDDGTAWFEDQPPAIEAFAVDRDGKIARVDFYAGNTKVGTDDSAPYTLTWQGAPAGLHEVTAVATDDAGATSRSNKIRMTVGMVDLAHGKPTSASSGDNASAAVDGKFFTCWSSAKNDSEWIQIDLGEAHAIDRVHLHWGWKIHAVEFAIDVTTSSPTEADSWTEVASVTGRPYQAWEAVDRLRFAETRARFVRLRMNKRPRGQSWGGYQLAAIEVPVRADD